MTRRRSTWQQPKPTSHQAATSRKAEDIYDMNQEHPQPSATEYESGSPDSWAETPTTNKNVEGDYDGDHVKRNEVGLGELRDDTWSHKDADRWNGGGKYDNQGKLAAKKASLAERIAHATLRTDNKDLVTQQAADLMNLPIKVLAATAERMNKVSPDALDKERKYRRALACCKLSANILGETATEEQVERLAQTIMTIDDPTLKSILKISAEVRTAECNCPPGECTCDDKTAGELKPPMGEGEEESEEETAAAKCMGADDEKKLEEMLPEQREETGCLVPVAPAPAPALTEMFEEAPAPAAPVMSPPVPAGPVAPATATDSPEITFDDESDITFDEPEEPSAMTATDQQELSALFDDDEEVQAQRQIQASEQEQKARELGNYGPHPAARTASDGAKKLGAVTRTASNKDEDELAALWAGNELA
jgi:hypothetical protein